MNSPEQRGFTGAESIQDRELDGLLKRGVEELAGAAEPSPRVWQRIEQQLRGGPPPKRQSFPRGSWHMTSVAQALAVASLLLVVGLSVWPMLQWPPYLNGSAKPTEMLTRTPMVASSADIGDDSLPFQADEGMLNLRQVMLWEQERAQERQAIASDTSPASDPILTHRRLAHGSD